MASFKIDFPEDLAKQFEKLENSEISKTAISRGLPILKARVIRQLSNHVRTGDLVGSIRTTLVLENKYGYFGVVRPSGVDRKGVRNEEKLAYLEYGSYGHNQDATPILAPACEKSKEKIFKIFQEVFDEVSK